MNRAMDDCKSPARMSLGPVDTSQSSDMLKRQTKPRTQSVSGLPQRSIKRHDCIGATRCQSQYQQQSGGGRAESTRLDKSKQKSSSESNLRSPRSRMELTDVYDDTHSSNCKSKSNGHGQDRYVTRTVELRRVANLSKAKQLDDQPKRKPLVLSAGPQPSTAGLPSKGNQRYTTRHTTASSQRPNTLLVSPTKVRPQKASSNIKSQVRTPVLRTPFRLFEPIADESLSGSNLMGEHNQSMPNLLRQNRRSSYSDDSIDGSYADLPDHEDHAAFSNDSASEFEETNRTPQRASNVAESLETAVSMPQLTMHALGDRDRDSYANTRYPLTPPLRRQRFGRLVKTSKPSFGQTQTEAISTVHCHAQTEPSALTYSSVQTDPLTDYLGPSSLRSSDAHVQTEVSTSAKCTVSCSTQTESSESEEQPHLAGKPLGACSVAVECETQTDVSCLYKTSSKRAVVLKGREFALNELNVDSDSDSSLLKFKHGRREVTESDYFLPRLNGTRAPALSDPGSRHDYMKAHSLPLHFVSTRPNIFPSNLDTELDDDSDLDGCSDSLSDDTVVDDAPPKRQVAPTGAKAKHHLPDTSRLAVARGVPHPHATKASENQAKEVANDWSQTDADLDKNSVTINLMVRKQKPKLTPVKTCANFYFQSVAPGANWHV